MIGWRGTMAQLTEAIIRAAIEGFEAQKKAIDAQISELRAMQNGAPAAGGEAVTAKPARRKFSAAARQRMREAQKFRWAKIKGQVGAAPVKAPPKAVAKQK